jgi:hypothetical protein
MLGNRFDRRRDFAENAVASQSIDEASTAFAACPMAILQSMTPMQQMQMEVIYRLAWLQAQRQTECRDERYSAFSVN